MSILHHPHVTCVWGDIRIGLGTRVRTFKPSSEAFQVVGECTNHLCKVEFNQPSCWLYSVPNLLVFQQLVILYLGGILVRIVSEIVGRNAQKYARKLGTHRCKPPEAAHVPGMPEVEASRQLEHYRTK